MTKFPLKISALWRQIYPALMVGGCLGQGYEWLRGGTFHLPNLMMIMGVAVLFVLYMRLIHPTMAGGTGLKLINGWGLRRPVAWDEIIEVRHARQFGFIPSLRIVASKGRVYWIGTEIGNLAELHALATTYGGPQHPLATALATPQYAL
jgi:hypothetical protein